VTGFLILSVDDLTYWAGQQTLFSSGIHAPNIRRLAEAGVSFTNAYTPEAICNPARTSFWSGKTPIVTGVHANDQAWHESVPPSETLMAHFLRAGFDVAGYGKLLHSLALQDDIAGQMFSHYAPVTGLRTHDGKTIGLLPETVPGMDMADHVTVDAALAFLRAQDADRPFMLNVGLIKPHLPWIVPKEFFDLYPLHSIAVPGLVGDDMSGVPAFIRDQLIDSRGHATPNNVKQAKIFLQGYLASLSYADAQIGRLLAELDASGRFEGTTILLWSDHGYHLGDRDNLWGKFTLWEEATKVPFVFKLPGNAQAGRVVDDVVNLVDAFPTLLDLANIAQPDDLSGNSLLPLLYGTGPANGDGTSMTWMFGSVMLRTQTHVLIRYEDGSEELYDMIADAAQINNLAPLPGHAATLAQLRATLIEKAGIVLAPGNGPAPLTAIGTAASEMFYLDGAGAVAVGGPGDDRYYVNHPDVLIVEQAGGGQDSVFTTVSYTLPDHVETLVVNTFTGSRATMIAGNALANTIIGSNAAQVIHGHGGDDTIRGGGGNDTIFGGDGNDVLSGGTRDDVIYGGAGRDIIRGQGGNDTIHGGDGNDIIIVTGASSWLDGGAGADRFIAAPGNNTVSYLSATAGVVADLAFPRNNTGDAFGDRYENIGNLQGSNFDDVLTGDQAANRIFGGAGNDSLYGGDGNDTLNGGPGADLMDGGAGRNAVSYEGSTGSLLVDLLVPQINTNTALGDRYANIRDIIGSQGMDNLRGDHGPNAIWGGLNVDYIFGRQGDDSLYGGIGNDVLFGGPGADLLDGGPGIDRAQYSASTDNLTLDLARPWRNTFEAAGDRYVSIEALAGGFGNDSIWGDEGPNELYGREGDDFLFGGGGDDYLNGASGHDWLDGGAGNDTMRGGWGNDTFVFRGGHDVIEDFTHFPRDRLLIDRAVFGGAAPDGAAIVARFGSIRDGQVHFDFGPGNSLRIESLSGFDGLAPWIGLI
jgi:arylsulfatase A-like enzyme/Ca2+-binding RTX toxin-like protein